MFVCLFVRVHFGFARHSVIRCLALSLTALWNERARGNAKQKDVVVHHALIRGLCIAFWLSVPSLHVGSCSEASYLNEKFCSCAALGLLWGWLLCRREVCGRASGTPGASSAPETPPAGLPAEQTPRGLRVQ